MTTLDPEAVGVAEPPPKRQKLSATNPQPITHVPKITEPLFPSPEQEMTRINMAPVPNREAEVGILCFVNESNPGFSGVLKQRYTDFLVNEVQLDGTVLHLTDVNAPRPKGPGNTTNGFSGAKMIMHDESRNAEPVVSESVQIPVVVEPSQPAEGPEHATGLAPSSGSKSIFAISDNDMSLLEACLGASVRDSILKLHEKALQNPLAKSASLGSVSSETISDRGSRTQIHKDVRRIFNSQLETVSDADGVITITIAQKQKHQGSWGQRGKGTHQNQSRAKLSWTELGGDHLHFSLYKENKDTMEVISYISSRLRTNPRQFAFAGTKDRRAVTVQRVSVHRVHAEHLAKLNPTLFNARVGDFKYKPRRLELGELLGNEFNITLRDCQFHGLQEVDENDKMAVADQMVGEAVKNMQAHGFINYFGMQRFGTYALGTDEIGKKILQEDFEGAVNAILAYDDDALPLALNPDSSSADNKPLGRDDIARAHAIYLFKTSGDSKEALEKLPRKFSGESNIIRHLSRNGRDFAGALLQIPRNLRLMYVHAYQSLVWNMAASERWTRFGDKVVKGDLVLMDSESVKNTKIVREQEVDENGEIIVLPAAHDTAVSADDLFQRARALTTEEALNGKYSIFDVVLPTPGYDIEYPNNEIGNFYKEFMMSNRGGELDPGNMRRSQKDFSLSGSYRKVLAQIGNSFSHEIRLYTDEKEQMVETDLEKITKLKQVCKSQSYSNHHVPTGQLSGRGGLQHDAARVNPWNTLPARLAEEDKAAADLCAAQKSGELSAPNVGLSQPVYKDTFVQKSGQDGQRTGYREITTMTAVDDLIHNGSDKQETASERATNATPTISSDQKLLLSETPQSVVPEASVNSGVEDTDINTEVTSEVHHEKRKDSDQVAEVSKKIAVIVKFQLGSSQYATMALRELMKQGGVQTYKPEFSNTR